MELIRLLHFRQSGLRGTLIFFVSGVLMFIQELVEANSRATTCPLKSIPHTGAVQVQSLLSKLKPVNALRIRPQLSVSKKEIKEIKEMRTLRLQSLFTEANTITEYKITHESESDSSPFFQTMWPWSGKGELVHAIAELMTSRTQFRDKLLWFSRVGHLVDVGFSNRTHSSRKYWWIIRYDVTNHGKRRLLSQILEISHPTMTSERCEKLVNQAVELTQQKILWYVTEHKTLNTHASVTNVLFTYDSKTLNLQEAEFEDWNEWEEQIDDRPAQDKGKGAREGTVNMMVWRIQHLVAARFKAEINCAKDYVHTSAFQQFKYSSSLDPIPE